MTKQKKTLPQIMARIIKAAMAANEVTETKLADAVGVHKNTVYKDMKEPEGMTMARAWLYFTALGVPVDDGLNAFADSFARSLVIRG